MGKIVASYLIKVHLHAPEGASLVAEEAAAPPNDQVKQAVIEALEEALDGEISVSLSVSGHELVVQFRQAFWDVLDTDQRRAVLHHEFTHVEVATDEQDRVKISLRERDVEIAAPTNTQVEDTIQRAIAAQYGFGVNATSERTDK